jgi:hypothetical protein
VKDKWGKEESAVWQLNVGCFAAGLNSLSLSLVKLLNNLK